MKAVLQILRQALLDVWGDLWTVMACTLAWYLAQLLIVPGPPATVALAYYGNRLAHGEVADLGDFAGALRRYWWPAWRWGALNVAAGAFLLGDAWLAGRMGAGAWGAYLRGLYLALLAGWLALQFFAVPFVFEQHAPGVRQALRNGAVLIGRNPGFAVALVVLLALLLALGTAAFMLSLAFGPVLVACAASRAVLDRLARAGDGVTE